MPSSASNKLVTRGRSEAVAALFIRNIFWHLSILMHPFARIFKNATLDIFPSKTPNGIISSIK
uniref:Uncharacterized protein n=1 Tax=Solanum lycopersicum TaxID=4081 RepID=A0A3Q7ELM2_SOLLC